MRNIPIALVLLAVGVAAYFSFFATKKSLSYAIPTVKAGATIATGHAKPWPHESSDIPADAKAVFGSMANGMRYMIYPNAEPPGRISMRLHIAAGSLMEQDDQRGVAHFLEHMVFNGSKNFSPDDLVPRMQRLGIGFGAHVNAYTSFDETVYMLDVPDLQQDTVNLCYTVMRDFADGALLKADEIDKERGVIISEKISRDSVSFRMMEKQFSQLLPNSLIPQRFPIGTEKVIKSAPRERFVDFYSRYYTPQRMTFIIVGDLDPAKVEETIQATFSSLKNPEQPGNDPDLGAIDIISGIKPAVFTDKELTSTDVSLLSIRPYEKKPDTVEVRTQRLPLALAHSMLNRRLDRLTKAENATILSGSSSRSPLFNFADLGSIEVTAKDDNWQNAIAVLEQEFRRAKLHGFTEAELAEAKANVRNSYQQAVKSAASRKSDALATALAQSINDDSVFSTPEKDLAIVETALETIDAETCLKSFQQYWLDDGYHLVLSGKNLAENAEKELLALYQQSASTKVAPPENRKTQDFAYTDFGTPGTITAEKEIADLGIQQFALSNGIKVNIKTTDFQKNTISLVARIPGGILTMPKNKPGLSIVASQLYNSGGLGKHSTDELEQLLAGKNVGIGLSLGEDEFTISGKTTPQDIELELQLLCASLIDPGYREEALRQLRGSLPMIAQQLKHTPAGPTAEIEAWMRNQDPRFVMPPVERLGTYTATDVSDWLNPYLQSAPMELSFVGDITKETLLPLLLKTIGALPARKLAAPDLTSERQMTLPASPVRKDTTYSSKVPQAIVTVNWPIKSLRNNQKEMRRMNILAEVLSDRMREEIREKLGASYSPNAGVDGSEAQERFAYLSAMSVGKPEDIEKLATVIRTVGETIGKEGITQDKLDRALKPTLKTLEKSRRDNTYWLGNVLSRSQEKPETLDFARNRDADYSSITVEEINALAKQYLTSDSAATITIQAKAED